jgi:uncharacterized membrane protein
MIYWKNSNTLSSFFKVHEAQTTLQRFSLLSLQKMKKIISYLFQGLLFTAPFAITGYIIFLTFNFIDGILKKTLGNIIGVEIPGLGILIIVFSLIMVGFLGQTIIASPLKYLINHIMERVPLLKVIYSAIKDLFSAFVGKEKKFNRPVLVLINPVSNLHKLGFLTEEDLGQIGINEMVAVYFPLSYSLSGEFFIVPKENIKPIDMNSAEVMKFIVSAGITGWNDSHIKDKNI